MSHKPHNTAYREENRRFLAQKAQEADVESLNGGVLMQRIKAGTGTVSPRVNSIVNVHYTGRLINGKQFDSTAGEPFPALFRLNELIDGWQIALTAMHEGDVCRVWIPAELGYGADKVDGIPGWSTLEFELELVKIAQL